MYEVTGTYDGVAYAAQYDEHGGLAAPEHILRLLSDVEGQTAEISPVGPFITVDDSAEGVLAALTTFTDVQTVVGDAPDVWGDAESTPGAVN